MGYTVYLNTFTKKAAAHVYAYKFRAGFIDVSIYSLVIETTSDSDKIEAFIELIKPFRIKKSARARGMALLR